jgi:cytochrome c biogenesis protein CcdA/thioredoxin-related protein
LRYSTDRQNKFLFFASEFFKRTRFVFKPEKMNKGIQGFLLVFLILTGFRSLAQENLQFNWKESSRKLSAGRYEIVFSTPGSGAWQLYAPNQDLGGVPSAEIQFTDSSLQPENSFRDSGAARTEHSSIFEKPVRFYSGASKWSVVIRIPGKVPASLQGEIKYAYGKGQEFYQESARFSVGLEGGIAATARIRIGTIDIAHPVIACGDDTVSQSIWRIFLIGLGAGLLSLLFPCIFPLIPLTVSFFTKRSANRKKGIVNALWYGVSIFLIFVLLSLPFHLFNIQPEILNNISTNVPLNLTFFVFFIAFAISFFGYYEIVLPSSFAAKADSRSGMGDMIGIFFMALTLVIVSFSCTGPILGTLLVGAFSSQNGAWQLTTGMAGFGLGLGLPFVLFALFPNWLQSLPKSGGWMNELKVVFGFIELAMAVKFLSQADLVKQWGFLKREVFIGIWILIGLSTVLYLCGLIRFPHDSKPRFTKTRIFFIVLFSIITIYLLPGITNTKMARLSLISGFPPPSSYSIYKHPVNYETSVEPLQNDYEKALQLARKQNKPLLIDFTGWACVNCRRMEENVWVDETVKSLMKNDFIVVSLYVDERRKLPVTERIQYRPENGGEKSIITVGDKWATFQFENFGAVSQPQYAILSPDEVALTKTKTYTPSAKEFAGWLRCGLDAYVSHRGVDR